MDMVLITGSAGLIGSEAAEFYASRGHPVIGIDNDLRRYFFGQDGSTAWNRERLTRQFPRYNHYDLDIRDQEALRGLFSQYSTDLKLIIHTAAQPSHDWAAREPFTDFSVNANGTLNLLEMARQFCPEAVFIFTSTNKVYGDCPNSLPLRELDSRWEIEEGHPFFQGIDETMSIDQSKHSLFGASKVAADVLVQEYGRYFGMKTACFRGGCLTGPQHSGAELHGFLAYLMKCCVIGRTYKIYGYKGKQVRDNIHSSDLILAFDAFFRAPRVAEVYNIGGGRQNNCSIREAVAMCQEISGKTLRTEYVEQNRSGDHIWYISGLKKFQNHYPHWRQLYDIRATLQDIYDNNVERWQKETPAG